MIDHLLRIGTALALILTAAVSALSVAAAPSTTQAQSLIEADVSDTPDEPEKVDPVLRDRFKHNYWRYARQFIPFEGDYIALPGYNRRYPNSRKVTVNEAIRTLTRTERRQVGASMYRNFKIMPPRAEAEAYAMPLPSLLPGEYGWIHSFEVAEIIDDDEMVIEDIWLIDGDALREQKREFQQNARQSARGSGQRLDNDDLDFQFEQREKLLEIQRDRTFDTPMRLKGFSTRGLAEGQRWDGPGGAGMQIAVVMQEEVATNRRGGAKRLVAVPAKEFNGGGLDEKTFIELLHKRGYTIESFVTFMQETLRQYPDSAEQRIFETLMPKIRSPQEEESGKGDSTARDGSAEDRREDWKAARERRAAEREERLRREREERD